MTHEKPQSGPTAEALPSEALSSEVLKLKIDDLFQEVENLKRRLAQLERAAGAGASSGHERRDPAPLSNPDSV